MKSRLFFHLSLSLLLLSTAGAADRVFQPNIKESSFKINGDSSLHPFECPVVHYELKWTLPAGVKINAQTVLAPKAVDLKVRVSDIYSEKREMRKKIHKAFAGDDHPDISFKLAGGKPPKPVQGGVEIMGQFTMAGETLSSPLVLRAKILDDKSFVLSGIKEINMTDYGMKPPTALMGMVKTDEVVQVSFEIRMEESP